MILNNFWSAVVTFRDHQSWQVGDVERSGGVCGVDRFVFSDAEWTPYPPDSLSRVFRRTARRLGMDGVRFHDPRHADTSLTLKADVHLKVVSERLEHSSIALTLDTYSHVMLGLEEVAAGRLEAVMVGHRRSALEESS